jgi:arylsulfatase A-like enzyme
LYDRALIVIAADHGASWDRVGTERRKLNAGNYQNVMTVPLFIKQPGQRQPQRVERPILTLDMLPTIADSLNIPLPDKVDGHSALAQSYPNSQQIRIIDNLGKEWHTFPLVTAAQKTESLQRKLAWFGDGATSKVFTATPFFSNLINKPANQLTATSNPAADWQFTLESPGAYAHVDLDSDFIPAQVEGWIESKQAGRFPADVAIAVNGVIRATYPYFKPEGSRLRFEAMVPEESFRPGKNTMQLFAINKADGRLQEIRQGH